MSKSKFRHLTLLNEPESQNSFLHLKVVCVKISADISNGQIVVVLMLIGKFDFYFTSAVCSVRVIVVLGWLPKWLPLNERAAIISSVTSGPLESLPLSLPNCNLRCLTFTQ